MEVLKECQPAGVALPQQTLHLMVRLRVPGLSELTLTEETSWLLDHGFVAQFHDPLDPTAEASRRWFLTELGEMHLRRAAS